MESPMDELVRDNTEDSDNIPQNANPEMLARAVEFGTTFLQSNGWYIVFAAAVLAFLWFKIQPVLRNMQGRLDDVLGRKSCDAEAIETRVAAMEAARRRLQEQHDAEAARYAEKKMQEEEVKRQQKLKDWDDHLLGKGYRSKIKPKPDDDGAVGSSSAAPKNKAGRLRRKDLNAYDDADASSGRWRPSRRCGPSSGG